MLKESISEIDKKLYEINQAFEKVENTEFNINSIFDYLNKFIENPFSVWKNLSFENKLKLQWFVFPNGISFDGNELRTSKVSLVFNLNSYFSTIKSNVVHNQKISTDTQKEQITLSSSQEEKDFYWHQVKIELERFKELVESPSFQKEKDINILNHQPSKVKRKNCK